MSSNVVYCSMKRKDIIAKVTELFELYVCNMDFVTISHFDVKVSVYNQYRKDFLFDLIKVLNMVATSPVLKKNCDAYCTTGYYDNIDDVTLDFIINITELKKL